MMLIDGLRSPWWTAVELSSAMLQGAILGIRVSSPTVCQAQQWVMLAQTGIMVAAAWYVKPFGAPLPNVFLLLSKLFAFIVALLVIIGEDLQAAAEVVTAVATGVGACDVLITIVFLLYSLTPQVVHRASLFFSFHRAALGEEATEGPRREVELEDLLLNDDGPAHHYLPKAALPAVAAVLPAHELAHDEHSATMDARSIPSGAGTSGLAGAARAGRQPQHAQWGSAAACSRGGSVLPTGDSSPRLSVHSSCSANELHARGVVLSVGPLPCTRVYACFEAGVDLLLKSLLTRR
jgi:hypothetical protein